MTAPADYEGLRAALGARQGRLSPRLAQVAQFCLNHPEEVAINGMTRIAALAGVPTSTVTRFAKELGFPGFAEFQAVFRERLLGPRPAFAARTEGGADLDRPREVFAMVAQAAVSSITRIGETLDSATLDAFVAALAGPGAVHVAAARGAFGIGAYAVYGFGNVGKRAHMIDNLGAMRAGQLAAMAPGEVLLALTFDDYTPETVETAHAAAARGHPVLAITDNELSPVVAPAIRALFVPEARLGHFRSQVPALVVMQAILIALGRRLGADMKSSTQTGSI